MNPTDQGQQNKPITVSFEVGQPFNPFGLFTGIFIPDALVRSMLVSPGAKLVYGRLARYAGQDGKCYPAVDTLATEIGLGERQVQRYISELERGRLLRRLGRYVGRAQTSNAFEFLWHEIFQTGVTHPTPEGVSYPSLPPVSHQSPKESQIEESQSQETDCDLDYPATNRKRHDSLPDLASAPARCKQYPRLREALARYMMCGADDEYVAPSERQVVDVMDAAAGASEDEVLRCLTYLREERRLLPGTRNGPRTFSWFPTVVGDYFAKRRARDGILDPPANHLPMDAREFDRMSEAF